MVRKEISIYGDIFYYNEQGQWHRDDGPALEFVNGDKFWFTNDIEHRIDGPSREYTDGRKCYFIMGKWFSYDDWLVIKDFPLLW